MVSTREHIVDEVVRLAARAYGVYPAEIRGPRRVSPVATARQMVMWALRELTTLSYVAIAAEFGGMHHSTIIHGVNKIASEIKVNEGTRYTALAIVRDVKNKFTDVTWPYGHKKASEVVT